ncbi:uncharacterized protein PHALS_00688 [Plasmopara halstedii]|uniref:Uncharacterized protein n=1 Tax=Plasmopara halstedii TaxID=4781 RepID=A0A0P1ARW2_PLAHL|nr:uncharacterized protein PHALS_00688 [Plasmopara halstedii]CEG44319.1 hypothetical protein PHALS_00688 [Plasmopara halstedii]|eukprot:XP_024580688.1 hypothetical protein PHALS_00688 [Plasmopara halstedii]
MYVYNSLPPNLDLTPVFDSKEFRGAIAKAIRGMTVLSNSEYVSTEWFIGGPQSLYIAFIPGISSLSSTH